MLTVLFAINFLGMIALPIFLAAYLIRKFRFDWGLVWAGALTFIAAQILHIPALWGLTALFNNIGVSVSSDTVKTMINAIVLGLAAGIFEETARYILFKFRLRKVKTWNEGVLVGVGHGGVEAVAIGVFGLITFISMIMMRNGDLTAMGIPADQIEATMQGVNEFWSTPAYLAILGLVERIFTMCLHIALSAMVLYSVVYKKPVWFWGALLWHAFVDAWAVLLLPVVGALAIEGIIGVFAIASLFILFKLKTMFVDEESAPAVIEA